MLSIFPLFSWRTFLSHPPKIWIPWKNRKRNRASHQSLISYCFPLFSISHKNESEGDSDIDEPVEDKEEGGEVFMRSYSDALSKELKTTTLNKSFVRANEQPPAKKDEGTSKESDVQMDEEEEFSPVDVDVNLVKSFLDSFSSQEGLPGPASNLLGLMGLQLPQDSNKHKK